MARLPALLLLLVWMCAWPADARSSSAARRSVSYDTRTMGTTASLIVVTVDSAGTVYKLNIPVTIELTPLEIGAGWRFNTKPSRGKTVMVSPYVGVAYVNQSYKETSSFAADEENTDVTDSGQAFFGGVEIGIRFVKIGIEAQYRSIPDALGVSGVSKTFNETNLGGTVFRLTFGVGF